MEVRDDDLDRFEADGAAPLPNTPTQGHVDNDGARIWYASYGNGAPVILLHGGLGNSGNWGYQVPALVEAGHQVIVIDSRGHGRSTRDDRLYTYELMASDVLAVMNRLKIGKAAVAGWSDGACIGMILGRTHPERISGVFFFACNMDPSGTKEFVATPIIERCFSRHTKDYAALSATPDKFDAFVEAVSLMQRTEPNYTVADLAEIHIPVAIVQSEHDEFIKQEHADYLVRHIPGAEMIFLPGVSHFAPLQRPAQFNAGLLAFLARISA